MFPYQKIAQTMSILTWIYLSIHLFPSNLIIKLYLIISKKRLDLFIYFFEFSELKFESKNIPHIWSELEHYFYRVDLSI